MVVSRLWQVLCVTGVAMAVTGTARARSAGECPPGDWFCDDEAPPELAPEPGPEPPEDQQAEQDAGPPEPPPPGMLPSQMDVRVARPREPEPESEPRALSPWSVSLRLQGAALGSSDHDAGMFGVGASLRYAFNSHLVLDLGIDSFGGTDYNGYDRSESSLATSLFVYLNPHQVVRTYVLAGLHVSTASVDVFGDQQDWSYVGAHTGLGLDLPIHERLSLALDLVGFIRGRTDSRAAREPEFTDGLGNLTNTSGGALIRGGVVLYW